MKTQFPPSRLHARQMTQPAMKLSTLVEIARKIESALRVSAPGTIDEMHARLQLVAGHCENPQEAVRAISEQIYDHPINGDFPAQDRLLLDIAAAA